MARTPITVNRRPFAVEPITGVMLPDGIFDTALYQQRITCSFTNTGAGALHDVVLYLEGVGDPNIIVTPNTFTYSVIPAGASVQASWLGNFQFATPGKRNVSLIAQAAGMELQRTIKQIFVSTTTFDPMSGTYTCVVPEGSLRVKFRQVIGPAKEGWNDCDDKRRRSKGPWIPSRVTLEVTPNPPYPGQFGDLPFHDPWWKIVAFIVAAIAALVAIIAAATGHGAAGFGASGTFDETSGTATCCSPDGSATADTTGTDTVAGVASVIAVTALAVGLTDAKDPWRRGQEATVPPAGEVTLSETVRAEFEYPAAPNAGQPYAVIVHWIYTRVTNVRSYTHEIDEQVNNTHLLDHVEVEAPAKIVHFDPPFIVKARFFRDKKKRYHGPELFAFALVLSPTKRGFVVPLLDDGIAPDAGADDGEYTGRLDLLTAYRQLLKEQEPVAGTWRVFVFAQDTNDAQPSMDPVEAATHIGGFMIASGIELSLDSTLPCPLKANALVEVVA